MNKQSNYEVLVNQKVNESTFKLVLQGDTNWAKCGQFVNITIPGLFLNRPISIFDVNKNELSLLIKIVGKGTNYLSQCKVGDSLKVMIDCGNGFDLSFFNEDNVLLIGGGIGCAPLYLLAKNLKEKNKNITAILGFRNNDEVMLEKEFKELGCDVIITSDDGSYGHKGNVVDIIKQYHYQDMQYSTCGPMIMLKNVINSMNSQGLVSLEARMGCGFGACMGCSIKTSNGYKRVCYQGPVFTSKELLWED